jgi:hypothetical protein
LDDDDIDDDDDAIDDDDDDDGRAPRRVRGSEPRPPAAEAAAAAARDLVPVVYLSSTAHRITIESLGMYCLVFTTEGNRMPRHKLSFHKVSDHAIYSIVKSAVHSALVLSGCPPHHRSFVQYTVPYYSIFGYGC